MRDAVPSAEESGKLPPVSPHPPNSKNGARQGKVATTHHTVIPAAWANDLSDVLSALEQAGTGRHAPTSAWTPEPKHKLGHKRAKQHSPGKGQLRKQQPALGGKVATRPWVESRENNLMEAVPVSLQAPAPFSTHMPGGKVKPAPHNLGALQKGDDSNRPGADTSPTSIPHLPSVSSHLVVGSQVLGTQSTPHTSWSTASAAQHIRSTSHQPSRTLHKASAYASSSLSKQPGKVVRDTHSGSGLRQSSERQLPGHTGAQATGHVAGSQHSTSQVVHSSTQLQHTWPQEDGAQRGSLMQVAASTWPVQDRDQSSWTQAHHPGPQQRYPAFVYAMVPLAKPLPVIRSDVRRRPAVQHNSSHWQHADVVGEQSAGVVGPHAAAVQLANQRVAAANSTAAASHGNPAGHLTSALLCSLISSKAPTIDPGRGLTGHMAALRAQQAARVSQSSAAPAAAAIGTLYNAQGISHVDLPSQQPAAMPLEPVVMLPQPVQPEQAVLQLEATGTDDLAGHESPTQSGPGRPLEASFIQEPLQQDNDMLQGPIEPASAASAFWHDASASGWAATYADIDAIYEPPDPRAVGPHTLPVLSPEPQGVTAIPLQQQVLSPSVTTHWPVAGQDEQQLGSHMAGGAYGEEVVRQQARKELELQLEGVVADLEQDLGSPVHADDLILKTRHTHHKTGPLPHLAPLLSTHPHLLPSPVRAAAVALPPTIHPPSSGVDTPSPGAVDTPGRTPMFARRASYNTAGSPSFRAMSTTPEADSQGGGQSMIQAMELRLSQKIAVDVDAAHLEATQRLEQVQAAAAAAAAAAASQAQAASSGKPPLREGLAESVAVVGAALVSAAAQAGTPKGRVLAGSSSSRRSMSPGMDSFNERMHPPAQESQPAALPSHQLSAQAAALPPQSLPSGSELIVHLQPMQGLQSDGGDSVLDGAPAAAPDTEPTAFDLTLQSIPIGAEVVAGDAGSSSQEIDTLLYDIVSDVAEHSASLPACTTHAQAAPDAVAEPSSGAASTRPPSVKEEEGPLSGKDIPCTQQVHDDRVLDMTSAGVPASNADDPGQPSDLTIDHKQSSLNPPAISHAETAAAEDGLQGVQVPVHPHSAPVVRHSTSWEETGTDGPGFSTLTVEALPEVDAYHGHVYQPPAGQTRASFATDLVQGPGVKPPSRPAGVYRQASSVAGYSGPSSYYPDDADTDYDLDMDDTRSSSRTYAEASAAKFGHRSTYNSLPGSDGGEGMASEDGEVLSVSAYGITAAQPLLSRASRTHVSDAGMSLSVNDVFEDGVRLLGQKYEVLSVVGEGAYGMVMKCRVRGSDPEKWVAVKEFKITDDDPDAEDVKRTSRREVSLLRLLQHPHVVAHLDDFLVRDRLFIVMEFVPCNLLELLEAQPGGMDRQAVRLILYQLCTAIAYIHSQGVIYRDIKPENLLVDEKGRLKLCDFGFARSWADRPEDALTDYVATRWYRAPELLLGPPYTGKDNNMIQSRYGAAIDIWAIGCLMGELIEGEPLFPGDSDLDQLFRIQSVLGAITQAQHQLFCRNPANLGIAFNIKEPMTLASRYEGVMSEAELSFISGLLVMDPSQRMTGAQCLQHPYLRDLWEEHQQAGGEYQPTSLLRFTPRTTQEFEANNALGVEASEEEEQDENSTLDPALAALMEC